jgi:hypothetical protein
VLDLGLVERLEERRLHPDAAAEPFPTPVRDVRRVARALLDAAILVGTR